MAAPQTPATCRSRRFRPQSGCSEEDLGAPIVERGHRYVGLTPQGQVALEHAHRILAEVENLRRGLAEIDKGLTGRARIGVIPTALPLVSQLTGPFYARFPGVTVAIISMNSQEIDRGIEDFELESASPTWDAEPIAHVKTKPVCLEEYSFSRRQMARLRTGRRSPGAKRRIRLYAC